MKTQTQTNKYMQAALDVLCAEGPQTAWKIKDAYWGLRSTNKELEKAITNTSVSLDAAINNATDFLGNPLKDEKLFQSVFAFMYIERAALIRDGYILDMDRCYTAAEQRFLNPSQKER